MIFWASGIQQEVGAPLPWGGSIPSGQILHVQFRSVCKFGIMLASIPFGAQALWRNMEFLDYSLMAAVRENSHFLFLSERKAQEKSHQQNPLTFIWSNSTFTRRNRKSWTFGTSLCELGQFQHPKVELTLISLMLSPQDTSHLFKK